MRLEIRGGRVVDPKSNTDELANIYIADGQVVALGQELADFESDHVLDATGLIACPGLIELGAYIGEPGEEHRGTIASESRAAVAGGRGHPLPPAPAGRLPWRRGSRLTRSEPMRAGYKYYERLRCPQCGATNSAEQASIDGAVNGICNKSTGNKKAPFFRQSYTLV